MRRSVVVKALRALEVRDVTQAKDVVRAASHPKHVLHRYFEWDDGKAGHRYRVWQARKLIQRVAVYIQPAGAKEPIRVRLYTHVRAAGAGYRRLDAFGTSKALRTAYLQQIAEDLRAAQEKYAQWAEVLRRPALQAAINAAEALAREAATEMAA